MNNVSSSSPREPLISTQFLKFCIVGVSSTVIDKGGLWLLLKLFPSVAWWILATVSFAFGVTNGFFWNRRWTFEAHGEGHAAAHQQYAKFIFSNIVGLLLNLAFTKVFLFFATGKVVHEVNPPALYVIGASLCAAPIVVFWNYFANKHWTFKAASTAAASTHGNKN